MPYSLLAVLVLVAHLAFVLFAALGGLLALRWRRMPWLHVPAVVWGAYIEATGRICPLTPLENSLRHAAGEAGYEGGFLEYYVVSLLYPDNLTRATQYLLAGLLVVLNLVVYSIVWRGRPHRRAPRKNRVRA